MFETARQLFLDDGYVEIGIDHFARPGDGLAVAQKSGTIHRNFQGYTEDTSKVLIGVGASSISRFPEGYAQNAPATSAYQGAIRAGKLSTSRGHRFAGDDLIRARLIEALMCDISVSFTALASELNQPTGLLKSITGNLAHKFPGMLLVTSDNLSILPHARPLTRMIARELDSYDAPEGAHSPAM